MALGATAILFANPGTTQKNFWKQDDYLFLYFFRREKLNGTSFLLFKFFSNEL
jgi:hypothetical protein